MSALTVHGSSQILRLDMRNRCFLTFLRELLDPVEPLAGPYLQQMHPLLPDL